MINPYKEVPEVLDELLPSRVFVREPHVVVAGVLVDVAVDVQVRGQVHKGADVAGVQVLKVKNSLHAT